MLTDSHAHLDFVEDLESALERAKDAGVEKIVSIGTNLEENRNAIKIAEKFSSNDQQIYAACGIHPKDGKEDVEKYGLEKTIEKLREIAKSSKKVSAIGEGGLDYYEASDKQSLRSSQAAGLKRQATSNKEKEFQRKLFVEQIKLAGELNLPLIVHCRKGWDEIFDLIEKNKSKSLTGVFHSWTGGLKAMRKALKIGFYISFSGIVTFKNAQDVQAVAKNIPLDRMLIETDSPFLTPEPIRGQKNEPGNVKIIADFLAGLRNQSLDEISIRTSANLQKLFNLL